MSADPVIERWGRLMLVLMRCEGRARRLARTLRRWQAAGEARPNVPPLAGIHRLPARLGLIAGAVTARLDLVFDAWADTS
ncbi:MAG: hypothetical protein R3C04_09940 [Hyphomonas sp.]